MGGYASQGDGSQQDPVDLTGGSGESCSQDATSSSAQTIAPTAAKAREDLTIPVTNLCSSDSDVSNDDGDLPATATEDLSATQEDDACHDSDNHEGQDSKDMDSVGEDPSGEYSQKRGAHVPRGDARSKSRGKRSKA